jgi:hypothetical protein
MPARAGTAKGLRTAVRYIPLKSELRGWPAATYVRQVRGVEVIDSELRLVAALRRAALDRVGPLPSVDLADALLEDLAASSRCDPPPSRLARES